QLLAQGREDLTALFRISEMHGYNEAIDNHYSLALDGHDDLFLLNAYGPHWSEMRRSDIVLVDLDGNVVEGEGSGAITAMQIHRQIHRARPDARCIMHTHMPNASAVACTKGGFIECLTQNSMSFYGTVATLPYGGQVEGDDEGLRLATAVAEGANVIFLQNHGVIVIGKSPAQAWLRTYFLERACEVQILAQSTGQELVLAPEEVARFTNAQWEKNSDDEAPPLFAAMKRLLDRDQPGWNR
ncbi:MAG: class II aldolase/adducin family protein, partial [Gaiellales bacterium]